MGGKAIEIPLSAPDITDGEIALVCEVLRTSHLSLGPKLPEFEEAFARYIGTRFAVAVNSGTSGLHLCVRSLGIGPGEAVITTPFSFVASANCLIFEGAVPVFVDIDPKTLNIDPAGIARYLSTECRKGRGTGLTADRKSGKTVRAILPVHLFGNPCDMDAINEIAREHHLAVIEDACESIGAELNGVKTGAFGHAGVFGFYPNKQMTTGEGGMIVTNDEQTANLCKQLRNQGRAIGGGWLAHDMVGYNYRLSELSCALGLAQLGRIDEILEKRARVAAVYTRLVDGAAAFPSLQPGAKRSWFVYVVLLPEGCPAGMRDRLLARLVDRGIGCSNYFPPIHLQPFYKKTFGYREGDFPVTESVSQRTVALPFHNNLREEEISYVVGTFKDLLGDAAAGAQGLEAGVA
jgi:perosamine synthetase